MGGRGRGSCLMSVKLKFKDLLFNIVPVVNAPVLCT